MPCLSLMVVLDDIILSPTVIFFSQIDLLAKISQSHRILSEVDVALKAKQMKSDVDEHMKAATAGTRYNVPLKQPFSSLFHVNIHGI
ncbi:hypothetical protein Tco_0889515 [Tanacetum coccineum]